MAPPVIGINCIWSTSPSPPKGIPCTAKPSLEWSPLAVCDMEEDHQDDDHHDNDDRNIPIDGQPCYNNVEGVQSENVKKVVESLFIVNSQTPSD